MRREQLLPQEKAPPDGIGQVGEIRGVGAAVRRGENERRSDLQTRFAAAAALHEHQIGRSTFFILYHTQSLRFNPVARHGAKQLTEPLGTVHQRKSAAPAAEILRRRAQLVQRAAAFIPCDDAASA